MKRAARAALVVPILLAACGVAPQVDKVSARDRYLAAKEACGVNHPGSLTQQADCRTRAADTYIRPFYKYGDLMTLLQEKRRALAVRADRHEISRASYDRQVARAEKAIDQEENRRNKIGSALLTHVSEAALD